MTGKSDGYVCRHVGSLNAGQHSGMFVTSCFDMLHSRILHQTSRSVAHCAMAA